MNPRTVARLAAPLLALLVAGLAVPLVLAIVDAELQAATGYGAACVLAGVLAVLARVVGRGSPENVYRQDAIGVVVLIWTFLGVIGGVPLMIEGSVPEPAAALFEAMSGFTTTGATVISDIDNLSRATNLWRCEMHWIGGMGIVVLFVAVFPQFGVGARHLFKTEVPGPITSGLAPTIRQTARALYRIYAALTIVCAALFVLAGMPLFDAVCHAMSTLGTGGFSSRGASIGAYDNAAIDWITCGFMLIAGINFGLYYALVRGQWREVVRNAELRFYLAVNLLVALFIAWSIRGDHGSVMESLRHSTFQTLAVTTTTGFMTEDFEVYPLTSQFILFGLMFMGGCAGSTAGGMKVSRVLLVWSAVRDELGSLTDPNRVRPIKLGRQAIAPSIVRGVLVFIGAYLIIFLVSSLFLVAMGMDFVSAMSATVACLSSVGPGLGSVGPTDNFANVPAAGQVLLSGCMLAGRLEIFVLFSIFTRGFWRK